MKKIILSTLVGTLCLMGSVASANDKGTQLHLGYEHLDLESYNGNGGVFGVNYVVPLKVLGEGVNSSVEVGTGIDLGFGSTKVLNGSEGFYNGDAALFVGYQYKQFNVRGTVGYSFIKVGNSSNRLYGALYGGSVGWNITKNWGIQAVYKDGSVKHSSGPDVDVSYTGLNIVWKK